MMIGENYPMNSRLSLLLKGKTMRSLYSIVAATILSGFSFSCLAEDNDGNKLYDEYKHYSSEGDVSFSTGLYIGYVKGVAEAGGDVMFCIPKGVQFGQIMDIVGQYLEQHPERRHMRALYIVTIALDKAFPCAKTNK